MVHGKRRWFLVVAVYLAGLMVLCACSCTAMRSGPISQPIIGIGAALLAALDQLLASGILSPEQHAILVGGVREISQGVAQAAQGVQDMRGEVATVRSGTVSPETVTVGGGLLLAGGAALQRWLRGPAGTAEEKADRALKRAQGKFLKVRKAPLSDAT